jgi:hypothetical protein
MATQSSVDRNELSAGVNTLLPGVWVLGTCQPPGQLHDRGSGLRDFGFRG